MEITLTATQDGSLRPATATDAEAVRRHWKPGQVAVVTVRKPRNGLFHRKGLALFSLLFEYWEPAITEYKGMAIQKNFDTFRHDLTVAAGFYDVYVNAITGELRLKAKSISFASMDDAEFEKLYSAVIDIGLAKILPATFDDESVRQAVENELMGFA